MRLLFVILMILIIGLGKLANAASYPQGLTPESQQLLQELQVQIKQALMTIAQNEKNAGVNMINFYYALEMPAQVTTNLGLVLDLENSQNGFTVISVTPGSVAADLKIAVGSKVLTINEVKVTDSNQAKAFAQLEELVPGETLTLILQEHGKLRQVTTAISGRFIPGIKLEIGSRSLSSSANSLSDNSLETRCGEVTVFYRPPLNSNLYSAMITEIDGKFEQRHRHSIRLPVGKHTVTLREQISKRKIRQIGVKEKHNRKNKLGRLYVGKVFELDIQANKMYKLGAKFIPEKKDELVTDNYWEPVVWETKDRLCSL